MISVVCKQCSAEFKIYKCRKDTAKFCSTKCHGLSMIGISPSLETRNKISNGHVGRAPWNKGLTKKDHPALVSISIKTKQYKKGVKLSDEHRIKMSIAGKKRFLHHEYSDNESERKCVKYKLWRESVFKRDNYICQSCKNIGGILNAHHIYNYSTHKDIRYDLQNGITMCIDCHTEFHLIYGQTNNNKEQVEDFLSINYENITV